MPQVDRDWLAYQQHRQSGGKDKDFAASIGVRQNNFPRWKRQHQPTKRPAVRTKRPPAEKITITDVPLETVELVPTRHSADSAQLDTIPHTAVNIPDNHDTVQTSAPDSAETLADHETRLQMLEGFMAALQAQARQVPVQHITVQSSADSAYALHSAAPVQTWEDPEDAKPERWNLWLPRGLKRRIESQARAAGIAPSSLVQRLLMAAINGEAVPDA